MWNLEIKNQIHKVHKVERDGKEYFYVNVGFYRHWPHKRLWVPRSAIKIADGYKEESIWEITRHYAGYVNSGELYVEFPLKGFTVIQGKKDLVLREDTNKNIFNIFVPSGYRGSTKEIVILSKHSVEYPYEVWSSGKGRLGVSAGKLVVTDLDHVEFEYRRTGRVYGRPNSERVKMFLDGRIETSVAEVEDLELLEEEFLE